VRKLSILAALALAACASHPKTIPVPQQLEVVERKVPIAVAVPNQVKRPNLDIDRATQGLPLEKQNAILRSSLMGIAAYVKELEIRLTSAGGKVEK